MYKYAELAVHNNVTFEANAAGSRGGAVSLPFDKEFGPCGDVCFVRFCEGWFDWLQQLTTPHQMG